MGSPLTAAASCGSTSAQAGRITLERLPAYAPELNPTEFIWGHLKHHELPNLCPRDFGELNGHARRALGCMRRRRPLVEGLLLCGLDRGRMIDRSPRSPPRRSTNHRVYTVASHLPSWCDERAVACGVLGSPIMNKAMTIESSVPDVPDLRPNRSRHVPEAVVLRLANDLALNAAWLLEPGVRGAWSESLARKVRCSGYPEIAAKIESGTYEPVPRLSFCRDRREVRRDGRERWRAIREAVRP
jgi:hypothetical protein